jgi:hypothetical protein
VGAQIGSLFNIAGHDAKGAQSSAIFNYAGGDSVGAQIAGLANYAEGAGEGAQAAAIFNYTGGAFTGAQIAGIGNYTIGDFTGAQIGLVNIAGAQMSGAQIGLVNWGGKDTGYIQQIGLVNISDNEDAIPIGLVNIIKNGMLHPLMWYDCMNFLNVGLKSGSKNFYTLLSFGTRQISLGKEYGLGAGDRHGEDLLVTRVGLGYEMSFGQSYLDFDILAGTMFDSNFPTDKLAVSDANNKGDASTSQLFQARVTFGFKAFEYLSAFVGVSYDYLLRLSNTSPEPDSRPGIFDLPWSGSKNIHRMGLFAGVQF